MKKSNTHNHTIRFATRKTVNGFRPFSLLASGVVLMLMTGCGGGGADNQTTTTNLNEVDLSNQLSTTQEVDRLRYFREINADSARKDFNLTGEGVRVTIMGEIVDPNHPDIQKRVVKQFNTYAEKGVVHSGSGNQPYLFDLYGRGHGHGTHIAGTIAAECDDTGIQGVACDADLDVYDLGAYGNERVPQQGWGNAHDFERFLSSFSAALNDVTQRNVSRILTGSFNFESPAIIYQSGGELEDKSLTHIVNRFEQEIEEVSDLENKGLVTFQNETDKEYLARVTRENGGNKQIIVGTLLPKSNQWKALEEAIKAYQDKDGVYIITESNNLFENRTSVLNAMPSLSNKVDADLWISAVMVQPKDHQAATNSNVTTHEYITPINSCGEMAADYCILIPSYDVLSTMTRKVADGALPLYLVNGRDHQVFSGHSMGAPMIAGALALMEEYNIREQKGYSMKDLVRILKDKANRSFTGYDAKKHGNGLLDIEAALSAM